MTGGGIAVEYAAAAVRIPVLSWMWEAQSARVTCPYDGKVTAEYWTSPTGHQLIRASDMHAALLTRHPDAAVSRGRCVDPRHTWRLSERDAERVSRWQSSDGTLRLRAKRATRPTG